MDLDSWYISIPKIPNIKAIISRRFEGMVKSVTVSKTPSGKFFASVLVEVAGDLPIKQIPSESTAVGIDLGIKDFCVLSNGEKVSNRSSKPTEIYELQKYCFASIKDFLFDSYCSETTFH